MKARMGIGTALVVLLTLAGPLGAMEQAHHTFTIPWFEVGPVTTVPGGTTTLFAVTNVGGSTATATITYYDVAGRTLELESVELDPNQTFTRNVPDLLPPPAGKVLRGFIEISSDAWLAVDYFQIGPGASFSTGDRALATFSEGNCREVEVRFLNWDTGGGDVIDTDFIFFFNGKTAGAHVHSIDFYDEEGNLLTSKTFPGTAAKVRRRDMEVFQVPAPFGMMRVRFPNGGAVLARYRGTGLYSASVKGTCLD